MSHQAIELFRLIDPSPVFHAFSRVPSPVLHVFRRTVLLQVDVAVKPLEWGTPWSDLIKLVYVQRIVKLQYSKK
jgi:hypothetical protein